MRVFLVIIHLWTDSKTARRTYQTENTKMFCNFVIFCNFVLFKMGVFCIFNYSYLSNKPTLGKRGPNSSQKITFFFATYIQTQRMYIENKCKTYNSTLDAILVLLLSQTHVRLSEGCIFFSYDFFHSNIYL